MISGSFIKNKVVSVKSSIVFIPGMWALPECWNVFKVPFQNAGYRCFTPNLPYHTKEFTKHPHPKMGTPGIGFYAKNLQECITKLHLANPILAGHSMGGLLAQLLATRVQVKALILINPASPKGINAKSLTSFISFLPAMLNLHNWLNPMKLSDRMFIYSMLHKLDQETQQKVLKSLVFESPKVIKQIGLRDPDNETSVDASIVKCPILVISSADDRITPPHIVRKVAAKYPQSTLITIPNSAHWVISEPNYLEVAGVAIDWLSLQR